MKKLNYFFLLGTIALTGTFAFTSCSSSEDEATAEVNPTYDGKSVKTQFAINIGNMDGTRATRMTATNTQENGNFLGMKNLMLFSMATGNNAKPTSTTTINKINSLEQLSQSDITNEKQYRLFYDVDIPVGTNNFLFYGMGPQGTDHESYMSQGIIDETYPATTSTSSTPEAIKFSLKSIEEPEATETSITNTTIAANLSQENKEAILVYILKTIANTSITSTNNNETKTYYWDDLDKTKPLGKYFYEFVGADPETDMSAQASSLSPLAGSSVGILGTLNTLYTNLKSQESSDFAIKGNQQGVTRGDMAKEICETIENVTLSSTSSQKAFSVDENGKLTWAKGTNFDSDPKFPQYLPNGAVQYKWTYNTTTTTEQDKYTLAYNVHTIGAGENLIKVESLVYPASLAYSCNTPAKASASATSITWPSNAADWQSNSSSFWAGWDDEVKSTSTYVALRNNVNYGVAKLATKVKATFEGSATGLKDNKGEMTHYPTNRGYKVTGILIGGQTQNADWEFLPTGSNTDRTVYESFGSDSLMVKSDGTESATNYCLLFDNYNSTATDGKQDVVKVALEFENNTGSAFEGHDGMVAVNQKFYLVGELDPTSKTATFGYDSNVRFPQNNVTRVFIQDHTTTVTFNVNSFENAYVNIPDLRTTQLVLGISVDLAWTNGIQFGNVTIGDK